MTSWVELPTRPHVPAPPRPLQRASPRLLCGLARQLPRLHHLLGAEAGTSFTEPRVVGGSGSEPSPVPSSHLLFMDATQTPHLSTVPLVRHPSGC